MALVITDAGIAASIRAGDLGVEFKIASISIGTEGYTPTKDQTELRAQVAKKPVVRSHLHKLGHLHFEADFDGPEAYEGKEIGYHLDDEAETLFAVDSENGAVLSLKRANSIVTEVIDLNLSASRIDNITVEISTATQSSESKAGIAELATDEEVEAGDDERIVTAKKLQTHLKKSKAPHLISDEHSEIQLSKLNVIFTHREFQLIAEESDCEFIVRVDDSVDLDASDVAFLAPEGEQLKKGNQQFPRARIVEKAREFRFIRINGEWYV